MSEKTCSASALANVAGPLEDFAKKLGGKQGEQWLAAFKRFLRKEEPWPKFPVWKIVKLGTDIALFSKSIVFNNDQKNPYSIKWRDGKQFSSEALDMCENLAFISSINSSSIDVEISIATTKELTGKRFAALPEIVESIRFFGGEICPAELGPQLYLQWEDWPEKMDEILVVMEPILDANKKPRIFSIGRGGLNSPYGGPKDEYGQGIPWAFITPRK